MMKQMYSISKLRKGVAYANIPGFYLNSPPRWEYCGRIVAETLEGAMIKAMYAVGSTKVKVEEVRED